MYTASKITRQFHYAYEKTSPLLRFGLYPASPPVLRLPPIAVLSPVLVPFVSRRKVFERIKTVARQNRRREHPRGTETGLPLPPF